MAKNSNLTEAKRAKNDEFYTQLSEIEKELSHYKSHFKDKVVLCNCNDGYLSNFFKYFAMNFNHLGLKKLITVCYNPADNIENEELLDMLPYTEGAREDHWWGGGDPTKLSLRSLMTSMVMVS